MLKTGIGIDISGSSIKIAAARSIFGAVSVSNIAESRIMPGAVSRGRIRNKKMLEVAFLAALKNLRPGVNINAAAFSPPEEITFIHPVMLGEGNGETAGKIVERELSCLIPLPLGDLYYDFSVVELAGSRKAALIFAVVKKEMDAWRDFLWSFRIRVDGFESSAAAISRYLGYKKKGGWVLLDIGRLSSSVYAFDGRHPLYSATEPVGGKKYFERIRAENAKKGYKLDDYDLKNFGFTSIENQLAALEDVVGPLKGLIVEAADGFKRITGSRPEETVVIGGFSRHPELIRLLRERLPGYDIGLGKGAYAGGSDESTVSSAQAIGSAVKGFDDGGNQQHDLAIKTSKKYIVEKYPLAEKAPDAVLPFFFYAGRLANRYLAWAVALSAVALGMLLLAYAIIPKIATVKPSVKKIGIQGTLSKAGIDFSIPANFGFVRQEGSIRASIMAIEAERVDTAAAQEAALRRARQQTGKDDMLLLDPIGKIESAGEKSIFSFMKLKREDALRETARSAQLKLGTDRFITEKIHIAKAVKQDGSYHLEGRIEVSIPLASSSSPEDMPPGARASAGRQEAPLAANDSIGAASTGSPAISAPAAPTSSPVRAETDETSRMRIKDLGGKKLNVRENPSVSARIVNKLEQRTTVGVIETAQGWAKIGLQDREQGWVMERFLENY